MILLLFWSEFWAVLLRPAPEADVISLARWRSEHPPTVAGRWL